jgi:hypothetical protein
MGSDSVSAIAATAIGLAGAYERLALVIGPPGSGKSATLREVADGQSWPLINLGLALSERLIELAPAQRPSKVSEIAEALVAQAGDDVVLVDDIEILFEPSLQLDPLVLLRDLARRRTLVVVWPGVVEAASGDASEWSLVYAAPDHPEHRKYAAGHIPLISVPQVG